MFEIRSVSIILALILCFIGFLFVGNTKAATLVVTKVADTNDGDCNFDCSLREAVAAANGLPDNDIVEFDSAIFNTPQTITLAGVQIEIANNGSLIINGVSSQLLTISGKNQSRIFSIASGTTINIQGLTIANGDNTGSPLNGEGGGILNYGGFLTISDCVITNNHSVNVGSGSGGGVRSIGGSLTINNSVLNNNTVDRSGAGVAASNAILNLNNTIISGNVGGAIANYNVITNINGSTIQNNTLTQAIFNFGGTMTLKNSSVTNNTGGGGIYNTTTNGTIIENTVISGNTTSQGGGGIFSINETITIINSQISQNSAGFDGGGGISVYGKLNVLNSTISNNHANSSSFGGGGIFSRSNDKVTLTNTTITGNSTTGSGGGIYSEGEDPLEITNSLISHNTSAGKGGGVYNDGFAVFVNSTFSGNNTMVSGGGISNTNFGVITSRNVTIAGNTAQSNGGGVESSGYFYLRNSIIADNAVNSGSAADVSGFIDSLGYNLIENISGAVINGTTTGNIFGQDPLISTLMNNGGPTLTHALLSGSRAIDAADPTNFPPTDQREVSRPRDGDGNGTALPDIGAFEVQAALPTTVSISGRITTANGRGISKVLVRLVDQQGNYRIVMTTPFGYYRFIDVLTGQTYTISVFAKKYSFNQSEQVLSVVSERNDINFIADN